MDDDEVDVVLAEIRHRDAIRILVASTVVGLPLLIMAVVGVDWGSFWDPILTSVLGFAVFAAGTAALHLRRTRASYAQMVRMRLEGE